MRSLVRECSLQKSLQVLVLCVLVTGVLISSDAHAQSAFPTASSKKGLQVEHVEDAIELGVKHAAFNLTLGSIVRTQPSSENIQWEHNGQSFYFSRAGLLRLDEKIKKMSDSGALVYLIVLVNQSGNPAVDRRLLHPKFSSNAPNRLSAFNVRTDEGRRQLAAVFSFIANRWSKSREFGRVVGYIIGNEVNSHWWWANRGECTMEEFCDEYVDVMRLASSEIRRQATWARAYVSLEHHWNIRFAANQPQKCFAGKPFMDRFAKLASDFEWHMAFHPYPENLFDPEFWKDGTATLSADTPRIGFGNLKVLTDFMNQPELHFAGKPRSIILSEQGFHTPTSPGGEQIQAAAYCYAYKLVEELEGVDAFILHRHIDHRNEGGLLLGLRRTNERGQLGDRKVSYEVFKYADTPQWEEYFKFALPILSRSAW